MFSKPQIGTPGADSEKDAVLGTLGPDTGVSLLARPAGCRQGGELRSQGQGRLCSPDGASTPIHPLGALVFGCCPGSTSTCQRTQNARLRQSQPVTGRSILHPDGRGSWSVWVLGVSICLPPMSQSSRGVGVQGLPKGKHRCILHLQAFPSPWNAEASLLPCLKSLVLRYHLGSSPLHAGSAGALAPE